MEELQRNKIERIVSEELARHLYEKKNKNSSGTKEIEDRKFYNDKMTKKSQVAYKVHPNMTPDAARSALSKELSDNNKDPRNPSVKTINKVHNISN